MKSKTMISMMCALSPIAFFAQGAVAQSAQCVSQTMAELDLQSNAVLQLDDQNVFAISVGIIGDYMMHVIDLTDPSAPFTRDVLPLPRFSVSASISQDKIAAFDDLIVTAETIHPQTSIAIIDAGDRDNLMILDQFTISEPVDKVVIAGDKLFLAAGTFSFPSYSRLITYDISNPAAPTRIRNVNMGVHIEDMEVADGQLVIQTEQRLYFHAIDENGVNTWESTLRLTNIADIDNQERMLYVAADDALQIIDYTDPFEPVTLAVHDVYDPQSVNVFGNIAYVRNGNYEILTIDISNPSAPLELGRVFSPSHTYTLSSIPGGFAISDDESIKLFDDDTVVTSQPAEQNILEHDIQTNDSVIYGNYLYAVQKGKPVFSVFDITDPQSPQFVRQIATTGPAYAIDANSTNAYVAVGNGIDVFTLQAPRNPEWVAKKRQYNITNVDVSWNRLAASADYNEETNGYGVIAIYDLTNRDNPALMGTTYLLIEPVALEIRGNILFCTDLAPAREVDGQTRQAYFRFAAIDISNPANMILTDEIRESPVINFGIGNLPPQDNSQISIAGDIAYVTSTDNRLRRYDISRVYNISQLDSLYFYSGEPFESFYIKGLNTTDDLLVLDAEVLHLYDISNPNNMTLIGGAPAPLDTELDTQSDVISPRRFNPIFHNDYIVATLDDGGIWTVDAAACGSDCAADLNGDGAINFLDIMVFITAYSEQTALGDFNQDGIINFFDINYFLSAYDLGCN